MSTYIIHGSYRGGGPTDPQDGCGCGCQRQRTWHKPGNYKWLFEAKHVMAGPARPQVPSLWWADGAGALVLSVFFAKEGYDTLSNALSPSFDGGCGCC